MGALFLLLVIGTAAYAQFGCSSIGSNLGGGFCSASGGASPVLSNLRITNTGDVRVTNTGDNRAVFP